MPIFNWSDPAKKAQVERDRADIAKVQKATRQQAYNDKVRHEAVSREIEAGTAEDAAFVNEFYGLLGIKSGKIEKVAKNKRQRKNTVAALKKIEGNKKFASNVRSKAAKARKQIEGK